jgi:N-methylhydantoinase A/oxoprolinase/acetone carboxylase beta subunit
MRDATRGRNLTDIGTRNTGARPGHGFDGVHKCVDDDGVERIVIGEAKGGAGKLGKGIKKADGTYARQMSEEWTEKDAKRMKERAGGLSEYHLTRMVACAP